MFGLRLEEEIMTTENILKLQPGDKVMWVHPIPAWLTVADTGFANASQKCKHLVKVAFVHPEGRFVSVKMIEPHSPQLNVTDAVGTAWPEEIFPA
mgnify:FL=1